MCFFLYCAWFIISRSNANFCVFVLWVFLGVAETRVVQYTSTVTVRISHFRIRMDCKTRVRSVKSCLRSEDCISLVGRRIFRGKRGCVRFFDPYGSYRSQTSRIPCSDVIIRCTLRMCSEYELLAMLTVCTEERTIRQRLLTVRNSAAVLNMTGRRGRESWIHVPMARKSPESNTWSPESTAWNPESLSVFDYLIWRDGSFGDCTRPKHRKKKPFFDNWKSGKCDKTIFFFTTLQTQTTEHLICCFSIDQSRVWIPTKGPEDHHNRHGI